MVQTFFNLTEFRTLRIKSFRVEICKEKIIPLFSLNLHKPSKYLKQTRYMGHWICFTLIREDINSNYIHSNSTNYIHSNSTIQILTLKENTCKNKSKNDH